MGEYKKPWLTFEEQADLLIVERGLVADRRQGWGEQTVFKRPGHGGRSITYTGWALLER